MWLTRLALRNPVLILMMSLMVMVLGWVSLQRLSVDLFPPIQVPVVRVATFYPGAGPDDIEQAVTQPVERAVAATPGVDRVESTSKQGVSVVSVWFNFDVDIDNAQFEVAQRVQQILNQLPPGIQQPFIIKFDITNIPVAQVAVAGEGLDERQLYDLAYNVIEPQLERIEGVASAAVGGGKQREIQVNVDADALRARGLGILDVMNAVRGANLALPSGELRAGDRSYNVFSNTLVEDPKTLEDLVLPSASPAVPGVAAVTAPVRLADVAEVVDGTADQTEIVRINRGRGVFLRVLKQPGANTISVVDAVRDALPKLRGVPSSVRLAISFDQSTYIRAAVSALEHEAVQGGVLAVVVILVFLASVRSTVIVAVAIPLSIVATFILLYFAGQTLNVFTLGGLALAVGRLVDDSIVELENIHRHLGFEKDRVKAVLGAAQEVAMPILVSTVTTIVVFFPVVFLTGVAKNIFLPLALTIAFALIMSFFVSRTVTPLLCYYWLPAGHGGGGGAGGAAGRGFVKKLLAALERLDEAYARALRAVLRRRLVTVVGILALFGASMFLLRGIGTEFFPETDESQFTVVFKGPIGTRAERTEQVSRRLEDAIVATLGTTGAARGPEAASPKAASPEAASPKAASPEAASPKAASPEAASPAAARTKDGLARTFIASSGLPAGRSALFSQNTGPHAGNVQVNLVPRTERELSDVQAAEKVRAAVSGQFPGMQMFFSTGGIVKRILNFGAPAPIDVEVLGYDLAQGAAYAATLQRKLRALEGPDGRPLLTDVQLSREEDYPELDIEVDRQKAGILGVSEQTIAQTVLASLVGSKQVAPIRFSDPKTGNEYDINVRLAEAHRKEVGDLGDIFVRTSQGSLVALETVAQVKRASGPVLIARKYLQRVIDVTANVAPGKDLGTASAAVQSVIDDTPPPEGFTATLGGQTQAQQAAFADLGFAGALALALVYMVLASQFRSLLEPLVIMLSVPLGLTGVFLALYLTGTTLSVNSFMGIIMMVGIVVSNGVLLVDFANVLRERGQDVMDATVEAGKTRLRPILMTTIATVVGLVPVAMGLGEGSETNVPLARAVIGGLLVSTFFTLFLVPALYTAVARFRRGRSPLEEAERRGVLEAVHAP